MRRLLSHRWLIKDHLAPVDPTSKYDDKTLDEELLTNIAIGLGWQRAEMRQELALWKFDALTATYLLVCLLIIVTLFYCKCDMNIPYQVPAFM